ncbi:MAG: DUF2225 domain-containing protein [Clostridium sp.]|nr:DUF2225 domain-containing protein [Clostridium sp.]
MGLFSGMEKFGLGKYNGAHIIEEEKNDADEKGKVVKPKLTEEDCLFDKHFTCPVCDYPFSTKFVRAGKLKLSSKDTDMRPIYEVMDPLKYDIITCDKCGYSSLIKYFGKLSTKQMRDIRDEVGNSFSGIDNSMSVYSYEDALVRYKLALVCAMVKKAKNSELGYICLKTSWIYRGMRESLSEDERDKADALYQDELECVENAYETFSKALSNEPLPIAGMDENTLKYLLAELARKLKKYEDAARMIGSVITNRSTGDRLKDQALTLKDQIKAEMKAEMP